MAVSWIKIIDFIAFTAVSLALVSEMVHAED
jgi:hypothetical protein